MAAGNHSCFYRMAFIVTFITTVSLTTCDDIPPNRTPPSAMTQGEVSHTGPSPSVKGKDDYVSIQKSQGATVPSSGKSDAKAPSSSQSSRAKYLPRSNILLAPFAYKSHVGQISVIGEELAAHGHIVYILLPESYPDLEEMKTKFKVITYRVKDPDFYTMTTEEVDETMSSSMRLSPLEDLRQNVNGFLQLCTNPLEDDHLPVVIRTSNINFAVVDGFPNSRCYYILLHNLRIPYVTFTTQYEPWLWKTPALPSFVPFPLAGGLYSDRMTFSERIGNLVALFDWSARPNVPFAEDEFVTKYLRPDAPESPDNGGHEAPVTYSSLAAASRLFLIDSDWAMEFPRPTMPNEIYVGGLTTRDAKPLPEGEIKQFVDSVEGKTHGIILATFGSLDVLTDAELKKLFGAFARIKQRVLMRYSREVTETISAMMPSNVLLSKWLPQNDLLGHPAMRLFLTHAGANGQFEALYQAVPTISFPLFGDQHHNALRAERFGCGRTLNFLSFSSDDLYETIQDVLMNQSYSENIRRRSEIFKDRSDHPRQRAVWWIEHVMKHNGGAYLHSTALDMPWYEYLMLDILLATVIAPVVSLTILITSIVCYCCTGGRRQPPKEKAS